MNEHDLHQWRVALAQLGERVAQLGERVAQLEAQLSPEVAGVPFVDHLGVEDVAPHVVDLAVAMLSAPGAPTFTSEHERRLAIEGLAHRLAGGGEAPFGRRRDDVSEPKE